MANCRGSVLKDFSESRSFIVAAGMHDDIVFSLSSLNCLFEDLNLTKLFLSRQNFFIYFFAFGIEETDSVFAHSS